MCVAYATSLCGILSQALERVLAPNIRQECLACAFTVHM